MSKLFFIRILSKFAMKLGGRKILRTMGIDETKLADKFVKSVTPSNGIIEVNGLKIKASKTARMTILTGENEPSTTSLIKKELKPGMRVLDLGANFGWFTLISSKIVGESGHVYAFEPDPSLMESLKTNVKLNKMNNVSFVPLAVSNKSGTGKLSLNPTYPTRNRLDSKIPLENTVDVNTISIDDFCEKNHVIVDFIKMDVEGSEVKALEGMKKTILASPKIKIVSEFNPGAISGVGSSPEDFINFLEQHGFTIKKIDENKKEILKTIKKEEFTKSDVCNLYCFKS